MTQHTPVGFAVQSFLNTARRYQRAVEQVFAIDPKTNKCFAEGSPTNDQETFERFLELDAAGKAFEAALALAEQVPA